MLRKRAILAFAFFCFSANAASLGPCHTRSRTMALIKNCFTGDMGRPVDGGSQFFSTLSSAEDGTNYCYNQFVMMEQKPTDKVVQVRVLKDSHQGELEEYDYAISVSDLASSKIDTPYVSLRGLSGKCFNTPGQIPNCASGWMTWVGLKERDLPLTLALGKTTTGLYTVSHLVTDRGEIKTDLGQRLHPRLTTDTRYAIYQTVSEIQHRLISLLQNKVAQLRQSGMTPKKMSEASEQFRYCAMGLESYLHDKKLPDLMSSQDKMGLAALTNYMNSNLPTRMPASQPEAKRQLPASRF